MDVAIEMVTPQPNSPFSRALQQWVSELKRKEDKKSPFYEKVLAAQNARSGNSGSEECEKCARDLSDFIQELEVKRRKESKSLQLCSKLQPFVDTLTQLMDMCSTLVQGAPFEVKIAFTGAQLVLQLATRHTAVFDKMVDIIAEIAVNLRCYEMFSTTYETSTDIQNLLLDAYKTIIGFWHRASKVLSQNSFRIALTNLVKPIDVEWQTCLDDLQKNSRRVLALAQATDAMKTEENRKLELTKQIADWIVGGEEPSKLDFRTDLSESRTIRQEGTCSWLFNQPTFESWYEANTNAVAWYNAPPGSGKTILSAAVAHHLEVQNRQVVYFRYSFDDNTRKKQLSALRSIALQLRRIKGHIPDQVLADYQKEVDHHAYHLQDSETAAKVVEAFIKQCPRVHIIVDGLDECSDSGKVLDIFRRLVTFSTYGVTKWFFTSRDEPSIRSTMEDVNAMEIRPSRGIIMNDITIYLDSQDKKMAARQCASCVQYWTAASEENFLYSKLMFDILCGEGVTCSDEIHEELQKFPPGLKGCYMRCIENITHRPERERELARRIFVFMVCAVQPLTVNALRNALAIMIDPRYDDHQAGRVPSLTVILSLCGSLVRLENSPSGNDGDRLVKFVHKSVLDFLKENPTRLGIVREDLHWFFVDEKRGNLEVGRNCLKYLQYQRYQSRINITEVLDNNEEHAFLKYAAAFWFEHLGEVDHSEELFSEVKSFVQSPAFWTCLAVQAKVRPHLFCRYTEIRGRFMMGLNRGELTEDDSIAIPLPDWLDLYKPVGHDISRAFYDYIKEWHEVLVSYSEAGSQCIMDQVGRALLPGLASTQSKSIRLSKVKTPTGTSAIALANAFFKKSKLHVRVTYRDASGGHWHEAPVSSGEPFRDGVLQITLPDQGLPGRLIRFGDGLRHSASSRSTTWSIRLDNLTVESSNDEELTFAPPNLSSLSSEKKCPRTEWSLITESTSALEHGSAFGFHLTSSKFEDFKEQETDSGYSSNSVWSGSEDDSDNEEDASQVSHCLVICCDSEKPVWNPWTEQKGNRSQISCALHPSQKIAAWSRSLDELQILDLATSEIASKTIEEPAAARASASVVCREMHFSPCGQYLYYLLVMFADNGDVGSTCSVFLSTFPFKDSDADMMRSCLTVERLTYKLGVSTRVLRAPYILSHWDTDNLYLCLPLLSCNPKIVRFNLLSGRSEGAGLGTEGDQLQTLTNPIFFPSSTPCRNPRILYRSSQTEKSDVFVLALDSFRRSDEEGGNYYQPMVMEWKMDKDGWRAWNDEVDGEERGLKEQTCTYKMLRGTFIDADRRFNVVVRSGLNWTKKAFLSCA